MIFGGHLSKSPAQRLNSKAQLSLTGVNIKAQNDKLFPDGFSPEHKLFPNIKGCIRQEKMHLIITCSMFLCPLKCCRGVQGFWGSWVSYVIFELLVQKLPSVKAQTKDSLLS